MRRFVLAHLLAVVAEYAVIVGVLVDAYERAGASATGLAGLAILSPGVVGGPLTAALTSRYPTGTVRRVGLAVQAVAYGTATAATAAEAPVAVVVAAVTVGLGAVCTLRPSGAALLPAIVRTSGELTVGNLWVSYCESAGSLAGPLLAGALLAGGGPVTVMAAGAVGAVGALTAATIGAVAGPGPDQAAAEPVVGAARRILRERPATRGVLGVVLARYVVVGALDVALVVFALDELGLASSAAGLLTALLGVGAVGSSGIVTVVAGRRRLAPGLAIGLGVAVVACVALGGSPSLAVALVALPALGIGITVINGLGRMLLQRSVEPRQLGPLFSLVELVAGVGMVLGALLAQALIRAGGADLTFVGLAVALVVLLASAGRAAWRADRSADLPVVEMSLLRALPMFAPLAPVALEALARSVRPVVVETGGVVMAQGEPGDEFFAVVDGQLDVVMSGVHVRTADRGSFVGEVALLADVPRTATVTATRRTELLALDRVDFLVAVTGSDRSHAAAWGVVRALHLDDDVPLPAT